jgi:hypothetical protein
MGLNYRDERNSTEPMVVTVAERQGRSREAQAEGSRKQTGDRRNTNGQRGRVRATSWLVTTKSEDHQDASGRVRRHAGTVQVLTRGELPRESGAAVSQGRSSVESWRKPAGAKGRSAENQENAKLDEELTGPTQEALETVGRGNCGRYPTGPEGQKRCNRSESRRAEPLLELLRTSRLKAMRESRWERMSSCWSLRDEPPRGATAGCGKPHVRWCGRVTGRNPRDPTRSN